MSTIRVQHTHTLSNVPLNVGSRIEAPTRQPSIINGLVDLFVQPFTTEPYNRIEQTYYPQPTYSHYPQTSPSYNTQPSYYPETSSDDPPPSYYPPTTRFPPRTYNYYSRTAPTPRTTFTPRTTPTTQPTTPTTQAIPETKPIETSTSKAELPESFFKGSTDALLELSSQCGVPVKNDQHSVGLVFKGKAVTKGQVGF